MEEKSYVVYITTGCYEDLRQNLHFVTNDEDKAKRYCNRFNKIMDDRLKSFNENIEDDPYFTNMPFLYEFVQYSEPFAGYEEVEVRK